VLVNPRGNGTQTVTLAGTFHKILGAQGSSHQQRSGGHLGHPEGSRRPCTDPIGNGFNPAAKPLSGSQALKGIGSPRMPERGTCVD